MKKINISAKPHEFTTTEKTKNNKIKTYVISIVAFVVVFGSISLFLLLKNYNFNPKNIVKTGEDETSVSETTLNTIKNPEGTYNIMLCLYNGNKLNSVSIVRTDMEKEKIKIKLYPATASNGKETLGEIFSKTDESDRINKLKQAFTKVSGYGINKYICADFNKFTRATSVMNGVTLKIPKDISYNKGNIKLSLKKGEWQLTGTNLLNYFLISNKKVKEEILVSMLTQYLVDENINDNEYTFNELINILDSDITAFDYNSALPYLNYIIDNNFKIGTF